MRNAFSMLELVFVIVILGILASIAIPKFSFTRNEAQSVSIQSDINQVLNAIPREVFTQNPPMSALNVEFIIKSAGLNKSRWVVSGSEVKLAKDGEVDSENDCVSFEIRGGKELVFTMSAKASPLCEKLAKTNESKTIPLLQ